MTEERHRGTLPGLLGRLLAPLVDALGPAVDKVRHTEPLQRDPALIRKVLPLLRAIDCYFSAEMRGWENVPQRGPFLVVGNHSGGAQPVDLWPFFVRWVDERGADDPFYALTYDLDFVAPYLGSLLLRMGLIPASDKNARRALGEGAPVVVFPGGDHEVFRPWTERNRVEFGGRHGFVKLALSEQVRVVPMTIHGAHESTFVLMRGRWLARASGLDRLHVKVFPFIWNIPLGLTPAFVPSVQLPAKITVQLGEPIDWTSLGPEAAEDPDLVKRCYDDVTERMQSTLVELAREHPYPILTRIGELRPDRLVGRAVRRWLS